MSHPSFHDIAQKYLLPLASTLELSLGEKLVQAGWGEQSDFSIHTKVVLECDRGLYLFSVGPRAKESRVWGVEKISDFFPPIRNSASGHQRLSLDEQAEFILLHWRQLEELFSPERAELASTKLISVGR